MMHERPFMRRLFIKILAAVGVILIILVICRMIATRAIRTQLEAFVTESCRSCTLDLGEIRVAVLPPSIILERVRFSGGDYKTTKVDAEVQRIVARTSFGSLISRKLEFELVQVYGSHVLVTEGDLPVPPSKARERRPKSWVIRGVELSAGTFSYIRVFGSGQESRKAVLHVKDIEAKIGELGTTAELINQKVHGQANGRLEKSGGFVLSVQSPPFSRLLHVDVDLQMTGQNLEDVSSFFQTTDGISFTGKLHKGRSIINVRENRLSGSVQVEYDGLDVHYEKTRSRGSISAFLSNLIKSFKFRPSDLGKAPSDQRREVELRREPKETLIHFILRGMKEGALKVAENK